MSTVLVTGGSGFIGSQVLLQLLAKGYTVRTTVRNLVREPEVRSLLERAGSEPGERLRFFAADLEADQGWKEAAEGCEFVLHVASPFPPAVPRNEDELIIPARDGALRVLRASRDAGVRRVVLTSSFAAVGYGHAEQAAPFDETSWTDLGGEGLTAYVKSKTMAERAAWEWIAREGGGLELATVNPVGVFGPVLSPDFATSILIVQKMMDGAMPGCPRLWFGGVDVRDVAQLHLLAMVSPDAKGERFLATAGDFLSLVDMARMLKRRMGDAARRVPTRELPDWLVRVAAWRDPSVKQILPDLGKHKNASSQKARTILGWKPLSIEDALAATAQSLLEQGLLKGARKRVA
jgi:nucleoside-diphosphate-sugar epimerase